MKRWGILVAAVALLAGAAAIPALAKGSDKNTNSSSAPCNDGTVTASPAILWPPNHKMQTIQITYADTDNDSNELSPEKIDITGVTETMVDINGKVGANGES